MKARYLVLVGFTSGVLLIGTIIGYSQIPAASALLPSGFTLEFEKAFGPSKMIRAKKGNENVPKPHSDPGIELDISWTQQPMVDQILQMMETQPEEPAKQLPGSVSREEPCGKQRYQNGILACRKTITPWVGSGKGPDLITFRIGWSGRGSGGLVGVSVSRVCGSKETAMGLINGIIPKIAGK